MRFSHRGCSTIRAGISNSPQQEESKEIFFLFSDSSSIALASYQITYQPIRELALHFPFPLSWFIPRVRTGLCAPSIYSYLHGLRSLTPEGKIKVKRGKKDSFKILSESFVRVYRWL